MIRVNSEDPETFESGLDGNGGFRFGGFGNLNLLLGDCASFVQELCPVELLASQRLVCNGLLMIGIGPRDVSTLHFHEELAFCHGIAKAGVNLNDTAGGQRNHGHVSGNVRSHDSGHSQFCSSRVSY